MSTDPPAPAGRRIPLRWAGPIVLSVMLIAALLYPFLHRNEPAAQGACQRRADAVAQIRAEPVLTEHPRAMRLGVPSESYSCDSSASTGMISFVSNGVVSRRLSGSLSRAEVRAYYAELAARSGWRPDEKPVGVYSATKPAGACPWWLVVTAEKNGYGVGVYYQPIGVPADDCEWASGRPMVIPLSR